MFDIEKFLDLTGYEVTRKYRRKGSGSTQEFFTPYTIVKRMCDKVSDEDWADLNKTFLEPCFGNGQFVIYMIYNRLQHGVNWETSLRTLYGVELMQDNVDETKERVITMLDYMEIEYDYDTAMKIMDNNLICSDFFSWDFKEWHSMTEEEIKLSKKKR